MNIKEAKRFAKKVAVVSGIIGAIGGFIGLITWSVTYDRVVNEKILCAPDHIDHSFIGANHTTRAVCYKNDGTLFLSEKVKK